MFPMIAETFHENIRFWSTVAKKILIIRQCTTNFAMEFWELDLVHQATCLHDVRESTESIVKVLENRSIFVSQKKTHYLFKTTSQSPTCSFRNS